jgi:polyferredoxin
MLDLLLDARGETGGNRPLTAADNVNRVDALLAAAGDWLRRHQRTITIVQSLVLVFYVALVTIPAFLPPPPSNAHIWSNLTLFAQFLFWGIWWPFVLLSMVFVGRLWCGVLCPEGSISEAVSWRGRGRSAPHWVTWKGWPLAAFVCTTAYGQLVSVYQYPKPALLILGGSTLAAIAIGYMYGRGKRVWCRYLCPVHGVFGLLSKLAPIHFRVDGEAWESAQNCAPLVPIRTMRGGSGCHMCGRCAGFRGAVTLSRRSPSHEIVHVAGAKPNPWETWLIVFGLMGLANGAFHWASSRWFVLAKQRAADWLIGHDFLWPITAQAPWFVLTNYPDQNDVMTPLDGIVLLGYLLAATLAIGGTVILLLAAAAHTLRSPLNAASWRFRFHHLGQSLIPVAGCGVFLGLFALTTTMLHAEGLSIPYLNAVRTVIMAAATLWSIVLAWRICGLYARGRASRAVAATIMAAAASIGFAGWAAPF